MKSIDSALMAEYLAAKSARDAASCTVCGAALDYLAQDRLDRAISAVVDATFNVLGISDFLFDSHVVLSDRSLKVYVCLRGSLLKRYVSTVFEDGRLEARRGILGRAS